MGVIPLISGCVPPTQVMASGELIRMAGEADIHRFVGHISELFQSLSGVDRISFAPSGKIDEASLHKASLERWTRGLNEPQWGRAFLLMDGSDQFVLGHLELRGGRTLAELHRASISMGVLGAMRGRGFGTALLNNAIDWTKSNRLSWLDLLVLSSNQAAIKLYEKAGFEKIGYRPDAFRTSDSTFDEILMSLKCPILDIG
ncbi:MAG TPA: GNAT family N-acetyltransferase [bacterium]|nr:GNAT family N-acetyltransferase [bacterium]